MKRSRKPTRKPSPDIIGNDPMDVTAGLTSQTHSAHFALRGLFFSSFLAFPRQQNGKACLRQGDQER
jgi:hypothetical protein